MNAIQKAIDDLRYKIPPQILNAVFINPYADWRDRPKSMNDAVMDAVVRPRVLVDCNLVGGTEANIPLAGCPKEAIDNYITIYRIPKERTQGRSILSVLNIAFVDTTKITAYGVAASNQNSTLLQAGQAVMDSHAAMPVVSTARCDLIGENVVMVRDTITLPDAIWMRCIVANDDTMSHLKMRSYPMFCQLVTLAVKSYIYNEFIVRMDMGELMGGHNLGSFKNTVEGYADSEELYQTFLREKWTKIALMNDNESYNKTLKLLIGGYR